jgi:hypothetical protein
MPVDTLRRFVDACVPLRDKEFHGNIVNKNICYALQYCQYLELTLAEGLPTSVIMTQQVKSYNVSVVAIVEAALEYGLRADCGYPTNKRLVAGDIAKEWRKRSGIPIDQLLDEMSSVLAVRNRVHLVKHEDDPQSLFRDTSYNFFLEEGTEKSSELLKLFLRSALFATAPNRDTVLTAFGSGTSAHS